MYYVRSSPFQASASKLLNRSEVIVLVENQATRVLSFSVSPIEDGGMTDYFIRDSLNRRLSEHEVQYQEKSPWV